MMGFSPDGLSVAIRAASFVLLFQASGATWFAALFKHELDHSRIALDRLILASAIGGVVSLCAHLMLEAARMTGEFAGVVDINMQRLAWTSDIAAAHAGQVVGLVLIMLSVSSHAYRAVLGLVGAGVAALGFTLTGHTSVHPWRMVLAPLLMLHVLIGAFWFGSLLPLWVVTRHESPVVTARIVKKFSARATWAVPLIAVAGIVMTAVIASGVPPLHAPYGKLIVTKLMLFVVLMGLAAFNKWRLTPAIATHATSSLRSLRFSLLLEWFFISVVLTVTAVLTAFYSPIE